MLTDGPSVAFCGVSGRRCVGGKRCEDERMHEESKGIIFSGRQEGGIGVCCGVEVLSGCD